MIPTIINYSSYTSKPLTGKEDKKTIGEYSKAFLEFFNSSQCSTKDWKFALKNGPWVQKNSKAGDYLDIPSVNSFKEFFDKLPLLHEKSTERATSRSAICRIRGEDNENCKYF